MLEDLSCNVIWNVLNKIHLCLNMAFSVIDTVVDNQILIQLVSIVVLGWMVLAATEQGLVAEASLKHNNGKLFDWHQDYS